MVPTVDFEKSCFLTSLGENRVSGPGGVRRGGEGRISRGGPGGGEIWEIRGGGGGSGNAYIDHFLIPGLFLSPAGVWRVVFRKCPMPQFSLHGLTRDLKITPLRKDTVKIVFFDMVRWGRFYCVLYQF